MKKLLKLISWLFAAGSIVLVAVVLYIVAVMAPSLPAIDSLEDARYQVSLSNWKGSVSEVWVNGAPAGVIAWQPHALDVTSFLKEGENEIVVKVTGSLKNTFGFFYNDNNSWIFGPHSWNEAPEKIPPASAYYLMDYGLFEPFELVKL